MFKVKYKETGNGFTIFQDFTVYDVRYDSNGYPQFLIYHNGEWRLMSAKHFTP